MEKLLVVTNRPYLGVTCNPPAANHKVSRTQLWPKELEGMWSSGRVPFVVLWGLHAFAMLCL